MMRNDIDTVFDRTESEQLSSTEKWSPSSRIFAVVQVALGPTTLLPETMTPVSSEEPGSLKRISSPFFSKTASQSVPSIAQAPCSASIDAAEAEPAKARTSTL